jgi:hypothetical protein
MRPRSGKQVGTENLKYKLAFLVFVILNTKITTQHLQSVNIMLQLQTQNGGPNYILYFSVPS